MMTQPGSSPSSGSSPQTAIARGTQLVMSATKAMRRLDWRIKAGIVVGVAVILFESRTSAQLNATGGAITISECEGVNACGFWVIVDDAGAGHWQGGVDAVLSVKQLSSTHIKLIRQDIHGPFRGQSAEYEGDIRDGHMEGTATSVPAKGEEPKLLGKWTADIDQVTKEEAWKRANAASDKHDWNQALHWVMAGVAMDDPIAENEMGITYIYGNRVPRDFEKARAMFLAAAEHSNKLAEENLAVMLREGLGGDRDRKQARYWHAKSIEGEQTLNVEPASSADAHDPLAALRAMTNKLAEQQQEAAEDEEDACERTPACMEQRTREWEAYVANVEEEEREEQARGQALEDSQRQYRQNTGQQ